MIHAKRTTKRNVGGSDSRDFILAPDKAAQSSPTTFIVEKSDSTTPDPDICDTCWRVYYDRMKDFEFTSHNTTSGYYIGPLKHIRANSSCRMCCFFYEMRWGSSKNGDYHLHGFSAEGLFGNSKERQPKSLAWPERHDSSVLFGVVPDTSDEIDTIDALLRSPVVGFIADTKIERPFLGSDGLYDQPESAVQENGEIYAGRFVKQNVLRYSMIREWLSACAVDQACMKSSRLRRDMPFFLIDCETRNVCRITSNKPKYIALSYVVSCQFPVTTHSHKIGFLLIALCVSAFCLVNDA
jgi:hypothetical protein